MYTQTKYQKGFTLVEILITLSILMLISLILFGFFYQYRKSQSVTQDVELIASVLYKARSDSMSSNGGMEYGVHFASSTITTFVGPVYIPSAVSNQEFSLVQGNSVANVSLVSGGTSVVFNPLTGETSQYGTVTLVSADGSVKLITLYPTGLIESN